MWILETKLYDSYQDEMEDLRFRQWRDLTDTLSNIMWSLNVHVPVAGMYTDYISNILQRNQRKINNFKFCCQDFGINDE